MNDTNEIPPRQYSGYQYQIVFSSYFSAWDRGTCRCTVSTVRRVRSDHGVGGNREARYPNTFLFSRVRRGSRGIGSPAIGEVPVAVAVRTAAAERPNDGVGRFRNGLEELRPQDLSALARDRDRGAAALRRAVGQAGAEVHDPV